VHVHLLSRCHSRHSPGAAVFFPNVRIRCPIKNTTVQKAVSGRQRPCAYAVVSAAGAGDPEGYTHSLQSEPQARDEAPACQLLFGVEVGGRTDLKRSAATT
jgi:hypothetical protein